MDDLKEYASLSHIVWHINNECNSTICKYCFTSPITCSQIKEDKYADKIVKRINENKEIKYLSILGGEPLLIKNLPFIISSLRKDIRINIDSNLIGISEIWSDSYKKVIFSTTIDSIDEKTNSLTRGHSAKKTIESIKFLLSRGNEVQVVIVASKHNLDTIKKTAEFLFNLGVSRIGINKIRMIGVAKNKFFSDFYFPNFDYKMLEILKELKKKYGKERIFAPNWMNLSFFKEGFGKEGATCGCAIKSAVIDWEGNLYPCGLMPFYWDSFNNTYGFDKENVLRKPIEEIFYNSSLFNFFRKKMLYFPVGCETCCLKSTCNHGCRFASFLNSTTLLGKDPLCKFTQASLYDVIGYQEYSPFSEKSKKRISGELGILLKNLSKKLGNSICDIGCGGGIWSFYLESLGKKVMGIDEDKTMIQIAKEYKNFHKKNSKFIIGDIFSFSEFPKVDSFLILDNLISIISKENLRKLFEQITPKTKKYIVLECYNRVPKEGDVKYSLNGNDILESVTKKSDFVFKRNFLNLNTNQSVTFDSYKWEKNVLEKELKKLAIIDEIIETKNSFVFVLIPKK